MSPALSSKPKLGQHSTASALIQLHDILLENAENKELTAALLLDLSAAFDIVDHEILLKKLESYNFSDNSVEWFKSYLEDRIQTVQVESNFRIQNLLVNMEYLRGAYLDH